VIGGGHFHVKTGHPGTFKMLFEFFAESEQRPRIRTTDVADLSRFVSQLIDAQLCLNGFDHVLTER